jgi:hypothetical protein
VHRARLQPPEHHVLSETEKLIQVLIDARLGDERPDILTAVDYAVVLQLCQRATRGLARGTVAAHQLELGGQARVRRHFLACDVVAQCVRNGDVHRGFRHGQSGGHVV